jgi:hypothetical protein
MRAAALLLVAVSSACAPDLRVTDCFDGICGELPTEPLFSFTRAEGGLVTALVDATSKTLATSTPSTAAGTTTISACTG